MAVPVPDPWPVETPNRKVQMEYRFEEWRMMTTMAMEKKDPVLYKSQRKRVRLRVHFEKTWAISFCSLVLLRFPVSVSVPGDGDGDQHKQVDSIF